MEILIYVVIFLFGTCMGFLTCRWWALTQNYSGTIVVTKTKGKTLYSLELEDYPEKIEFQKKVIFKVDAFEEPDRK